MGHAHLLIRTPPFVKGGWGGFNDLCATDTSEKSPLPPLYERGKQG